MCDPPLVFAILEVLTLLRRACENEFTDEVSPDNSAPSIIGNIIISSILSMSSILNGLKSPCS